MPNIWQNQGVFNIKDWHVGTTVKTKSVYTVVKTNYSIIEIIQP